MPLPDERPRQSVANLIGRFEKQKSSSGATPPPPTFPRTSSVSSHRTEDSALEEIKERREWPPKSVESPATSLPPPIAGPGKLSLSFTPTPPVEKKLSIPPDAILSSASTEAKPSIPSPSAVTPTQSTPVKARPSLPSQSNPTTTRPASSVKSPAPKPTAKASSTTPLKPMLPGGSASSTPLKPQHTGQSITPAGPASRASAKRVSTTPRPSVTTTPLRAKTPLSVARSKTPSSDARPKTPSGLYAPTAASLARSKAGAPAPLPVEKARRKITTDLSKPTAASASKIRSPPAPTPTRGGKPPVGKPATTTLAVKSPIGKTTTLTRQSGSTKHPVSKPVAGHTKASIAKKPASSTEPPANADITASNAVDSSGVVVKNPETQNPGETPSPIAPDAEHAVEHEPEDATHIEKDEITSLEEPHVEEERDTHVEAIEAYDDDFPDETTHGAYDERADGDDVESSSQILEEPSVPKGPDQSDDVQLADTGHNVSDSLDLPNEINNHPEESITSQDISASLYPWNGGEIHEVNDNAKANLTSVGTDLEDIVNLLESGMNNRRPSIETASGASTGVAGEIPDEY